MASAFGDHTARSRFREGLVIPAMPLALSAERVFDPVSQRAILRYYVDAGAGGIAVGVHSTQFAIREAPGFFENVLTFARDTVADWAQRKETRIVLIAGVCGKTRQAISEAQLARSLGYDAGLLSLSAYPQASVDELVEHVRTITREIPVIGFYLQTAVGGRRLPYEFWRRFAELDNTWGIKVAPFDRYATLDVMRGVADSGRANELALYTGNDDAIVTDLLTKYRPVGREQADQVGFVGGLLGHWGVWTKRAVELFDTCRDIAAGGSPVSHEILALGAHVTEMNAAVFDAANGFAGCLPGIHTVLERQGLMRSACCLDPNERLSPGQKDEIDRVIRAYPYLTDDDFVREHLTTWREER
ncbi:MAG: dihydrodipicolinate synthase family protein [Spirochaetaceae bacterium]|nr:MAG: dihydrodipicolinate synthase family protein [Spirochaetaceae bacterium]